MPCDSQFIWHSIYSFIKVAKSENNSRGYQEDGKRLSKKKALGLCTSCGVREPLPGANCCEECREYRSKYFRQRTQKRKALGLCVDCGGEKQQPDKAKCNRCLEKMNSYMRQRRENWIDAGLCLDCGSPTTESHRSVEMGSVNRCSVCYLKMISSNVFGTTLSYIELENLLKAQNHQCAYTGRSLILQHNCELDHIIPIAKGGPHHISNLQWVHRDVNKMKFDLQEEDFLSTIIEIVHYRNLVQGS